MVVSLLAVATYLVSHVPAHSRRHFGILGNGSPVTNSRYWSFSKGLLAAQCNVQQELVSTTTHNKNQSVECEPKR